MPITNPTAIVDAIVADLAALNLNPTKTWLYAEPTVIMPDVLPLLAVWCASTDYQLLTAGVGVVAYRRVHNVRVAWYVFNGDQTETGGTGDPATVQALEVTAEQLTARIGGYASGVPTFGNQLVATLEARSVAPTEGVVWRAFVSFTVEENT